MSETKWQTALRLICVCCACYYHHRRNQVWLSHPLWVDLVTPRRSRTVLHWWLYTYNINIWPCVVYMQNRVIGQPRDAPNCRYKPMCHKPYMTWKWREQNDEKFIGLKNLVAENIRTFFSVIFFFSSTFLFSSTKKETIQTGEKKPQSIGSIHCKRLE